MMEINKTEFDYSLVFSIALVTFLMPLDITALAMVLRDIQNDTDASLPELQWIVNSYNVVYASVLPIAGILIRRFGWRSSFIVSCAVFGVISVAAGASAEPSELIVMRSLQGGSGALVLIAGMTTIRARIPQEKLGLAFGIWGSALGAGRLRLRLGTSLGSKR